jgi:hypothetical protein
MKTLVSLCLVTLLTLSIASCGKDNYDEPTSHFTGKVVYNGTPIGVRGSDQAVFLQFWQDGYELYTSIDVHVTQDGSYSSMLFDGVYKLVTVSGRGPWVSNQDTTVVKVKGNTTQNYEVTPYYTLSNISYSISGSTIHASFDVTSVTPGQNIEYVALMVNKTKYVDFGDGTHVAWTRLYDVTPGHVEMELDVTEAIASHQALFARVGLKIDGIGEGIYDTNVYTVK